MQAAQQAIDTERYAKCIDVSKRVRWDIDRDVIRGRRFDFAQKFLPDGLSRVDRLASLEDGERRLLSQIQGRTYANLFGLIERFIGAKMLEISRDHWLGDQTALEALVRFTDEELKHQELFRRVEALAADGMPAGYRFLHQPNDVARFVLGKSTWAVLALTCHIELFTQAHYRKSIDPAQDLSPLYKDVFFFHWKEESQHAVVDELEWLREDGKLTDEARDRAVDDLIALIGGMDHLVQGQAEVDAAYFTEVCGRALTPSERVKVHDATLGAYRWQYIVSGVRELRFAELLASMTSEYQAARIRTAWAPLMTAENN